ncbi:MAG: YhjD/YihY/BrkB family envelope integrity protein [Ornithinimicrobium sp.]
MILGLGEKKRAKRGAKDRSSATQKSAEKSSEDTARKDTDDRHNDSDGDSAEDSADAPHPESEDKPDSPGDVTAPTWGYTARKTLREFTDDECTDIAAALTYYAVLALFPALIAILSLLSLVGQSQKTVETVMEILTDFGGSSVADTLKPTIESLATAPNGLLALIIGLATALWSASAYIMAFSRGMNRVYEIREGRPIWKLRPMMLFITLIIVLMVVVIALMLVLSGSLATTIGNTIGLGSTVLTVWTYAKWPVILILAILTVALLYYSTPNVKQPKFRWMSVGAAFAIIVWIVASIAFGFYVANFSSYSSTYGSLAGVIIFLLWLWITNVALLFGAELDAELERSRQLQGGLEAEEELQLPARDRSKIDKLEEKEREDIKKGKALRRSAGRTADPEATQKEKSGRR